MKITPLRTVALAGAAASLLFISSNQASAASIDLGIRVGGPPPPRIVERQWAPPYRGAVWIAGHYEWVRGRWAWVSGYYTYPPRRGGHWVPASYPHGYYRAGHWAY